MDNLALTYWLATERKHVLNPPLKVPCDDPNAPLAFTTTEKLTAFLKAREAGRWNIKLISNHEAVVIAVADAHQHGARNICFDPEVDGSGGTLVGIQDILRVYGQTAQSE
jgi:hypothetical protein